MIIPQPEDWENDTVTIPVSEYIQLTEEIKFLHILESMGVENWEGFEDALKEWRDF